MAIVLHGGESQARVAVTAFTSGTANCTLRATESDTHAVYIQGAASALSVTGFPNILPDGGAVSAYLSGSSIVNHGDGGTVPVVGMGGTYSVTQGGLWDVFVDGGSVGVSNFPSILPDGGAVSAYLTGTSFVNHGDGGTVPVVIVGGAGTTYISQDGGTLGVVGLGGIYSITQGGLLDVFVDGGSVGINNLPSILPDGGAVGAYEAGNWFVYADVFVDGGSLLANQGLAGTYANAWPADTSEQTSCTSGVTLCALTQTSITLLAGAKSQTICNNFSTPTCFGFVQGLSCAPAIDAGTTIGVPLQPGQCFTENGGVQMYCVDPTTAMTTPDAGLNYASCK